MYAGLAALLVVAVVAVAYGSQAPSFGVAEFAPAARSQVSAPDTTVPPGSSSGRTSRGRGTTTTAPAVSSTATTGPDGSAGGPPTTRVARSRPCVGSPPRQIEDPMSPACMAAIFEGDNGGATATGVSATEIAVAVPGARADRQPQVAALFEFFNRNFELYGRRLRPVFVAQSANSPATARTLASDIAAQQVFAVTTGLAEWGGSSQKALYQELARRSIVTVAEGGGQWLADRTIFDPFHPYLWSVRPSLEDYERNVGDFICTALAGRPARHAPDPGIAAKTRKFGVVASGAWEVPWTRPLVDRLAGCDVVPVIAEQTTGSSPDQSRSILERFRSQDVTTVLCLCEGYQVFSVYDQLSALGYGAERLVPSSVSPDDEIDWGSSLADPTKRMFGISETPRIMPIQAEGWFQAYQQIDPNLISALTSAQGWTGRALYTQLLLLASGIQGAGPVLTADTFAQGLMNTQFANTGAGVPPYWQPSVGFGPGDHSFYDDYVLAWSSAVEGMRTPSAGRPGSWCYVGRGARFSAGNYPADADSRFFDANAPCR